MKKRSTADTPVSAVFVAPARRVFVPLPFRPFFLYPPAMPDADALPIDDVKKVAKLARLALPEDRLQQLSGELASILHYIDKLKQVDTAGVEPMAHALPVKNVLRPDTPEPGLPLEGVLRNAPETDGPFFKVPKVIGGDEDSAG